MASVVFIDNRDGIAVVTVENPPVNALSHAVRSGLAHAVAQTNAE